MSCTLFFALHNHFFLTVIVRQICLTLTKYITKSQVLVSSIYHMKIILKCSCKSTVSQCKIPLDIQYDSFIPVQNIQHWGFFACCCFFWFFFLFFMQLEKKVGCHLQCSCEGIMRVDLMLLISNLSLCRCYSY